MQNKFFWCNFFAKKHAQITCYKNKNKIKIIKSTMIMITGYKVTTKANIIDI
jgi:hypothetical protein